jgi:hypothetical protein
MKNFLGALRYIGRPTHWYVLIVLVLAAVGFINTGNQYLDIGSGVFIALAIYGGGIIFLNSFRGRRKPPISD